MSDRLQPPGKRGGPAGLPPPAPLTNGAVPPSGGAGARVLPTRDSRGRERAVRAATDDAFAAQSPNVYEYLTCMLVGDQGRIPATVIVCAEDGMWKVCLSDRETDQVLWVTADTWDGLWQTLEGTLRDGRGQWRTKKPYVGKR